MMVGDHRLSGGTNALQVPFSSPGTHPDGGSVAEEANPASEDVRRSHSTALLQQALREVQQERASHAPPPSLRVSDMGTNAPSLGGLELQQRLSGIEEERQQLREASSSLPSSVPYARENGARDPSQGVSMGAGVGFRLPEVTPLVIPTSHVDCLDGDEEEDEPTPTFIPAPPRRRTVSGSGSGSASGSATQSPMHSPMGGSGGGGSGGGPPLGSIYSPSRFRKPQPLTLSSDPSSISPCPSVPMSPAGSGALTPTSSGRPRAMMSPSPRCNPSFSLATHLGMVTGGLFSDDDEDV